MSNTLSTVERMEAAALQFQQLEIMASDLMHDTKQLEKEFNIKHEHARECDEKIMQNEQKLIGMNKMLIKLNDNMLCVENEIQQNKDKLEYTEKCVRILEELTALLSKPSGSQCPRGEHNHFMALLEHTDIAMSHLDVLITQLLDKEQYLKFKINPYETIWNILALHVDILTKTDKKLDLLMDKNRIVEGLIDKKSSFTKSVHKDAQ